ncbi:MAG: L,D-transpeptidase [Chitinispirillaceae bacterium]|nr:L,D-transpeptidase [Chitinispirillaceae bacterium]
MDTFSLEPVFDKIRRVHTDPPHELIAIDTAAQRLHFIGGNFIRQSFTVSTSRFGIGNREGSNMTPLGLHRVIEKIGSGAPPGRIFRDRLDTGIDWHPGLTEDNLILTRIIRLEGLEDGINRGSGIDTYGRYIYIHGTNREDQIGTPLSHGCICMTNHDIIELFDMTTEGTLVFID